MPVDYFFMKVTDGRIIKNTLVYDESELSKTNRLNVAESKKSFGLHFDWLSMTDLFYSYFHSEMLYQKSLINKNSGL